MMIHYIFTKWTHIAGMDIFFSKKWEAVEICKKKILIILK